MNHTESICELHNNTSWLKCGRTSSRTIQWGHLNWMFASTSSLSKFFYWKCLMMSLHIFEAERASSHYEICITEKLKQTFGNNWIRHVGSAACPNPAYLIYFLLINFSGIPWRTLYTKCSCLLILQWTWWHASPSLRLQFIKNPGYLWMFPVPNPNPCHVGATRTSMLMGAISNFLWYLLKIHCIIFCVIK